MNIGEAALDDLTKAQRRGKLTAWLSIAPCRKISVKQDRQPMGA
jgi:hypothetical protein